MSFCWTKQVLFKSGKISGSSRCCWWASKLSHQLINQENRYLNLKCVAFDFEVQILKLEKRLPFRYGSVCQHGADYDVNENEFDQLQSCLCSLPLSISHSLSQSISISLPGFNKSSTISTTIRRSLDQPNPIHLTNGRCQIIITNLYRGLTEKRLLEEELIGHLKKAFWVFFWVFFFF